MLGWLVRHGPSAGQITMGEIVGRAERRYQIPRKAAESTLRMSLSLDGKLDDTARRDLLDRVFGPGSYQDHADPPPAGKL
jgi:hypothetical protein